METLAVTASPQQMQMRTRHNGNRSDASSIDADGTGETKGKACPEEENAGSAVVADKGKGGRTSKRKRKSSSVDSSQICPVCGVTVRPLELEYHLKYEVQQLDNLIKRGRIKKDAQAAYLATKAREEEKEKRKPGLKRRKRRTEMCESDDETDESDSDEEAQLDGNFLFLEVRGNRHARQRKKELQQNPASNPETMLCPVCFIPLAGSDVDKNRHVENCLNGQQSGTNERTLQNDDDVVDIEGGEEMEEEAYETYEWAGETRIRATSLLQGGFQGLGYQTTSTRNAPGLDDEEDLDVDGDETAEYGPQQYSEEDVLARCPSRSSLDTGDVGYEDNVSDDVLIEGCLRSETEHSDKNSDSNTCTKHVGLPSSGIQIVVESLKAKVRELESELSDKKERLKCLICMGAYNIPLVSIQCWHVHCEDCWLTTLASKKLCPQCQMITASSQLRRIYL